MQIGVFVKKARKKQRSLEAQVISLAASLQSSGPAGAAKHRRLFAKHPRGRSSASLRSLLFCCDAVLKQTVRNVVFVNREIRFLNQVSKSL